MNTRRVRAGQPVKCDYFDCGIPNGECSRACERHYAVASQQAKHEPEPEAVEEMPIQFFGDEPWPAAVRFVVILFLLLIVLGTLIPIYL
jgi:hypothetical protein